MSLKMDTGGVSSGGQAMAAQQNPWSLAAGAFGALLNSAIASSGSPTINTAIATYAGKWNPVFGRLPKDAETLGHNATGSAGTVTKSDDDMDATVCRVNPSHLNFPVLSATGTAH